MARMKSLNLRLRELPGDSLALLQHRLHSLCGNSVTFEFLGFF